MSPRWRAETLTSVGFCAFFAFLIFFPETSFFLKPWPFAGLEELLEGGAAGTGFLIDGLDPAFKALLFTDLVGP